MTWARPRRTTQVGASASPIAASSVGVDADVFGGTFEGLRAADYSGVYLFNPFGENVCARRDRLDETVELSERRYHADLRAMTTFLRALHPGARVAIYCGWGGVIWSRRSRTTHVAKGVQANVDLRCRPPGS
ncbi:MAG: hypothetical protein JNL38_33270 [Myxococcales bacterium]|nr:hypothetical protein [Myxococcales bacterium]